MALVFCAFAALRDPSASSVPMHGAISTLTMMVVWWSSIVLAAMPYVVAGTIVSGLAERCVRRHDVALALVAMFAPGCDCASTSYALAFVARSPAVAGFSLTWSAAAGPVALLATRTALGPHLVIARLCGAAVAAVLTAALWQLDHRTCRRRISETDPALGKLRLPYYIGDAVGKLRLPYYIGDDIGDDIGDVERGGCERHAMKATWSERMGWAAVNVAVSALIATIAIAARSPATSMTASPLAAGALGALLSPCSTSDAVLARVLLHDAPAQAAFVLAAQCADIRQVVTIARAFGGRRAVLALASGVAGCIVAAAAAH